MNKKDTQFLQLQSDSQQSTPKQQQRVHNQQFNPVINSMTCLSNNDEKPLSAMSMIPDKDSEARRINIFTKNVSQNPVYIPINVQYTLVSLEQLEGFQKRDYAIGTYYGQIVNEKKHGIGLMVYRDGRVCEGHWENDRKYGHCFELLEKGDKFTGEYINGKSQGFGILEMKDGERFEGEWINGLKHGRGKWLGVNGDTYEGEWIFGKIDGNGTYKNTAGDKYTGSFSSNLKHGRGIEHFKDGDVYNGEYLNGKPEGQGMYLWENGNEFRGSFMNGHRHGTGKWIKWISKDLNPTATKDSTFYSYEGEYENDKKHGEGIFIWPSGNFYKGTFLNDFRHGYGEMFWIDGSHYKGMWEKGCQNGEGELYKKGQGFKQGYFENNVLTKEKRPQSSNKLAKKIVWQGSEEKQINMSCYVLDRSSMDLSNVQVNKTYNTARDAKNNFMPSIAKKPMFLLYSQQQQKPQYLGKTQKFSEQHSFQVDSLVDDPDFQLRENPKRLTNLRMLNHFYKIQSKQIRPQELSFSLKQAFIEQ